MIETVVGRGPFHFAGTVPGDKSITHRALLLGAVGQGETVVRNPLRSADTRASVSVVRALGVEVEEGVDGVIRLAGGRLASPPSALDCANSGTTARLLLGLIAGRGVTAVVEGDPSLSRRPMDRVVEPLRRMGAAITYLTEEGRLPVRIEPVKLNGTSHTLGMASAQVKSALILAALSARGRTVIVSPRPTRDHTERLLLGIRAPLTPLDVSRGGEGWMVEGPAEIAALGTVDVPGDPSSAAFLFAAAAMTGGVSEVRNVLLNPRRTGILDVLEAAGVTVERRQTKERPEPIGDVRVEGRPTRPVDIGADTVPDLIDELPVLAAVLAVAPGISRVTGAGELRVKESDRIEAMAEGLRSMGAEVEVKEDGWVIHGGHRFVGGRVRSVGDHRVAMALAVAGLAAAGETVVEGAEAVDVSFPGFFDILRGMEDAGI